MATNTVLTRSPQNRYHCLKLGCSSGESRPNAIHALPAIFMQNRELIYRVSRSVKKTLPIQTWQTLRRIGTAVYTPMRFARVTGHWQSSLAGVAKSPQGEPVPWFTHPAIDFLSQRDYTGKHVLEFGAGQSTHWWSRRAASILSFEEDELWYRRLSMNTQPNVSLHHVPVDKETRSTEAIRAILNSYHVQKFDVIVIDGHLREELAVLAFDKLATRGALILDDSEGYGFYKQIRTRDCRRVDFYGFASAVSKRHCTSLVYVGDCFLLDPEVRIAVLDT
jgi:hypothetical protein